MDFLFSFPFVLLLAAKGEARRQKGPRCVPQLVVVCAAAAAPLVCWGNKSIIIQVIPKGFYGANWHLTDVMAPPAAASPVPRSLARSRVLVSNGAAAVRRSLEYGNDLRRRIDGKRGRGRTGVDRK